MTCTYIGNRNIIVVGKTWVGYGSHTRTTNTTNNRHAPYTCTYTHLLFGVFSCWGVFLFAGAG